MAEVTLIVLWQCSEKIIPKSSVSGLDLIGKNSTRPSHVANKPETFQQEVDNYQSISKCSNYDTVA